MEQKGKREHQQSSLTLTTFSVICELDTEMLMDNSSTKKKKIYERHFICECEAKNSRVNVVPLSRATVRRHYI